MTGKTRKQGPGEAGWQQCPQGELGRLTKRLHQRRQRRRFLHTALSLSVVATASSGGLAWWLRDVAPPEYDFAGIRCTDVQKLAMSGPMASLDAVLADQIRRHVALCPRCGPLFKEMGMMM